jgi:hypothetical protein
LIAPTLRFVGTDRRRDGESGQTSISPPTSRRCSRNARLATGAVLAVLATGAVLVVLVAFAMQAVLAVLGILGHAVTTR